MLTAMSSQTVFDRVGGYSFFESLADRFYSSVEKDPKFLAMYPKPDDLAEARLHLAQFLSQYWGGPTTYSDSRGHPRLRMRHVPFQIGDRERDTWLKHMGNALDESQDLDDDVRVQMSEYFAMAANHLVNYRDP